MTVAQKSELDRICADGGGVLYPPQVVKSAQSKKSPLHELFDWDDSEAAKKWRLEQARGLIRAYVVMIPYEDGAVTHRAYVSMSNDRAGDGGYTPIQVVMDDTTKREMLLEQAKRELKSVQNKYGILKELASVWAEIDKAMIA